MKGAIRIVRGHPLKGTCQEKKEAESFSPKLF